MAAAVDESSSLPVVGSLIAGVYEVEEVLGRGGMGMVVAARHRTLMQRVAIKCLLPSVGQVPGAVERFVREARAAVAIQSEHIARVLNVGTLENGLPYMVMEHLAGVSLGEVLKARGRLTAQEAVDVVLQACKALAEAHALGIMHRDLKPSNLFVTRRPDGSPFIKVLDFGLSKVYAQAEPALADEQTLTETGMLVGSPPYMAPELFQHRKDIDARVDVWALGVILYMLLTGRRPFSGPFAEVCAAILFHDPAPLTELCPDIPAALDEAVRRCLVKDRAQRTQSVADLAVEIAPFGSLDAERSLEWILRVSAGKGEEAPPLSSASRRPPPSSLRDGGGPSRPVIPSAPGSSPGSVMTMRSPSAALSSPASALTTARETSPEHDASPSLAAPGRASGRLMLVAAAAIAVGVFVAVATPPGASLRRLLGGGPAPSAPAAQPAGAAPVAPPASGAAGDAVSPPSASSGAAQAAAAVPSPAPSGSVARVDPRASPPAAGASPARPVRKAGRPGKLAASASAPAAAPVDPMDMWK